jgi:hypothetical protein
VVVEAIDDPQRVDRRQCLIAVGVESGRSHARSASELATGQPIAANGARTTVIELIDDLQGVDRGHGAIAGHVQSHQDLEVFEVGGERQTIVEPFESTDEPTERTRLESVRLANSRLDRAAAERNETAD